MGKTESTGETPTQRLGRLIRDLSYDRDITQVAAGKLLGLAQSSIGAIARGEVADVGASKIKAASQRFGIRIAYFFDDVPDGDGSYRAYLLAPQSERSEVRAVSDSERPKRRGRKPHY